MSIEQIQRLVNDLVRITEIRGAQPADPENPPTADDDDDDDDA